MRRLNPRRFIIAVLVCVVILYALFEARGLLRGPLIVIERPASGSTVTDDLTIIEGRTERISSISMNGRPIFISEEGAINEPVALLEGINTVTFEGTDRFGKTTKVELVLVYRSDGEAPALPASAATSSAATSTATSTIEAR